MDKGLEVPAIVYPDGFDPPGPATQADRLLELMEDWLNSNADVYTNFQAAGIDALSPEGWVDFRKLYGDIHWMYTALVEDEDTPVDQPVDTSRRVPNSTPAQAQFWDLTDRMPTETRQLCEKVRGMMGTGTANKVLLALRKYWEEGVEKDQD